MEHDTLSDVLRSVRLRSALYFFVSCSGKWVAEAPSAGAIAAAVMPGTEHVIEYHVLTGGECWAAIVGEPPLKLRRGDVVMLTHGDPHVLSSAPGMRADPYVDSYYAMRRDGRPFRVAYDGGSAPSVSAAGEPAPAVDRNTSATLVCGFIGCDLRPFNPLIATLPRLLYLPRTDGGGWSDRFLEAAAQEPRLRGPGGEALLERMSEMIFIDAVRRHVDTLPERSTGWLAGLRDRHVGRALALMHARPGARWTLDELSKDVGLSRSALHERFVELVGQPAMQYLTSWRMQLAAQMLRSSQSSVAAIAIDVGYGSEAAFSRAFKRLVGQPPGAWRRLQTAREAAARPAE